MRIVSLPGALVALTLFVPVAGVAQDTDIELLRTAIDELRVDYDARIAELERRLAVAEQNAAQAGYVAKRRHQHKTAETRRSILRLAWCSRVPCGV